MLIDCSHELIVRHIPDPFGSGSVCHGGNVGEKLANTPVWVGPPHRDKGRKHIRFCGHGITFSK